uniref:Retrovirus-related Pol polyprotein from transposon TNT 1-94 n=1 Tax=Tanacetum cinerariifolium TaxID=118510 RepID=A0A699HQ77_TANCI|nr:retrovirus-related Pol polyprotein from transposon TNT 1-94 [Tanacetum cinerariifolium]
MVSLKKNQTYSLVKLPTGKKASQSLWMFSVKEEQDGRKRYKARLVVKGFQQKRVLSSCEDDYNQVSLEYRSCRSLFYLGALNDTSTQHKSEGFQLAGKEENLVCKLKKNLYRLKQAPRQWYMKFNSFMRRTRLMTCWSQALTWQNSTSLSDSWNEEPCIDVHQVGDEREVKVQRSFNWPPNELLTEEGVLSERGYSQFNDVTSRYLVSKNRLCVDVVQLERGDVYLTEKEQQQLLLDEKALRVTLEEEARAEKVWEGRIRQEQAHAKLFRWNLGAI